MPNSKQIPDRHFDHADWRFKADAEPKLTLDFNVPVTAQDAVPPKKHFMGAITFLKDIGIGNRSGNSLVYSGVHQEAELKIIISGEDNIKKLTHWLQELNANGVNDKHLKNFPVSYRQDFRRSSADVSQRPEPPIALHPSEEGFAARVKKTPMSPIADAPRRLPTVEEARVAAGLPAFELTADPTPRAPQRRRIRTQVLEIHPDPLPVPGRLAFSDEPDSTMTLAPSDAVADLIVGVQLGYDILQGHTASLTKAEKPNNGKGPGRG